MKIEHLAIWVSDLEKTKAFYVKYFGAEPNERYRNPTTGFTSYFLSFDGGPRLEIMNRADIPAPGTDQQLLGYAHMAFSVGSKDKVIALTDLLRGDGFTIAGEPRTTGDGYFESVVLDPEGNRIEITV